MLIEWNGVAVLTDPWVGGRSTEGGRERFSFDDLPEKIDFALITHCHHDHFVPETLVRLRHRIECLVVPRSYGLFYTDVSLKLAAKRIGFKNVVEMDSLDSIAVPNGEIISVPFLGEHERSSRVVEERRPVRSLGQQRFRVHQRFARRRLATSPRY